MNCINSWTLDWWKISFRVPRFLLIEYSVHCFLFLSLFVCLCVVLSRLDYMICFDTENFVYSEKTRNETFYHAILLKPISRILSALIWVGCCFSSNVSCFCWRSASSENRKTAPLTISRPLEVLWFSCRDKTLGSVISLEPGVFRLTKLRRVVLRRGPERSF